MKIKKLIVVLLFVNLIVYAFSTDTEFCSATNYLNKLQSQAISKAVSQVEETFTYNTSNSINTLRNPLRLFKIKEEKQILGKFLYMYKSKFYNDPKYPLNVLDFKVLKLGSESIQVYVVDQNVKDLTKDNLNTKNFLMAIKLANIDLPCLYYLFLCTYEELLREYGHKLNGVDFRLPPSVEKVFGLEKAKKQCIVITIGEFVRVADIGFICFDSKEDAVFYQSFFSEKIYENQRRLFTGQILMVNDVINMFNNKLRNQQMYHVLKDCKREFCPWKRKKWFFQMV